MIVGLILARYKKSYEIIPAGRRAPVSNLENARLEVVNMVADKKSM